MDVKEYLQVAFDEKRKVDIIYSGGSSPNSIRQIEVHSIDDEKIWAKCVFTGERKQFLLSKIKIPSGVFGGVAYTGNNAGSEKNEIQNLTDVFQRLIIPEDLVVDYDDENLMVYSYTKRGVRRKHPFIKAYYSPFVEKTEYDFDNDTFVEVVSKDPTDMAWYIDDIRMKNLAKAVPRLQKAIDDTSRRPESSVKIKKDGNVLSSVKVKASENSCIDDEKKDRSEYPGTLKGLLNFSLEQEEFIDVVYDEGFEASTIREVLVTDIDGKVVWCQDHDHKIKCFHLKSLRLVEDGENNGYYLGGTADLDSMVDDLRKEIENLDDYGIYNIYINEPFIYIEYNSSDMDDLISIEIDDEIEAYVVEAKYHSSEKTIRNTDDLLKLIMSVLERHYKVASKKESRK